MGFSYTNYKVNVPSMKGLSSNNDVKSILKILMLTKLKY